MNKSEIGHRTLMNVMVALANLGKGLYAPFGEHGRPVGEAQLRLTRRRITRKHESAGQRIMRLGPWRNWERA